MIPTLSTERLILGPFALEDGPRVEELAGHEAIARMTLNIPHPYPPGAANLWIATHLLAYLKGEGVTFAIRLKDGTLIGAIGLTVTRRDDRAELGYWMGVPYWNQGYTTEAARACLAFGFSEMGLQRIMASHLDINPASGRVMQKIGMQKEGHLRRHIKKNDAFFDLIQYGILKEEA